jgi:NADPH:quinone reductase-like Zn-dependent oxidoreductase
MALPLQQLVEQVETGAIAIALGPVFRMDQIVEAHAAMERSSTRGKLVVVTSQVDRRAAG